MKSFFISALSVIKSKLCNCVHECRFSPISIIEFVKAEVFIYDLISLMFFRDLSLNRLLNYRVKGIFSHCNY